MRINTAESIETGHRVHARFGSWQAARAAADFIDGKFVIPSRADDADSSEQETKSADR